MASDNKDCAGYSTQIKSLFSVIKAWNIHEMKKSEGLPAEAFALCVFLRVELINSGDLCRYNVSPLV